MARRQSFVRARNKNRRPPSWPTTIKDDNVGPSYLKIGLLFFLIAAWFYFVFLSSAFQVSAIEVNGPDADINQQLLKIATSRLSDRQKVIGLPILPNRNVFFFQLNNIDQLKKEVGTGDITYQKNYLDRAVYVTYQRRQAAAILSNSDGQFYLDQAGQIVAQIDPTKADTTTLPVIFLSDAAQQAEFKVDANLIDTVRQISQKADDLSLKITAFKIDNSPDIPLKPVPAPDATTNANTNTNVNAPTKTTAVVNTNINADINGSGDQKPEFQPLIELMAVTKFGWTIYFGDQSMKDSKLLAEQLYNLEAFCRDKFKKIDPKKLQYIDLRFGEKIFYK